MGSFESEKWRAAGFPAARPGIRRERDAVARCNLGARPRASRPRHKERVLQILGRRGIYQGTSGRFDAILSMSGRRRLLKNKKAHDGSCALSDLGGAFPAAG
jgi:hypothetical protein